MHVHCCPVCTCTYSSVLSREHLEAELLVVLSSGEALPSLKPLQRIGLHLERVKRHSEFSRTLQEAFDQAHFSIIVVRLKGGEEGEEEGGRGGGERRGGGGGGERRGERRGGEEGGRGGGRGEGGANRVVDSPLRCVLLYVCSECQYVVLCVQVLGDAHVSVGQVLPKLVGPVVAGHSDMTLTQDNTVRHDTHTHTHTQSHTFIHTHTHTHTCTQWLGLLSYPLTFSTAAGGNASIFCLLKAIWMKGTLFSISVDLSSKGQPCPSFSVQLMGYYSP